MAYYRQDMQSFMPSQFFSEKDKNMEFINHFAELNPTMLENFNISDFPVGTFLAHQQPEFPAIFAHDLAATSHVDYFNEVPVVHTNQLIGDVCRESKKRKVIEQSRSSSYKISSAYSGNEAKENSRIEQKNSLGKGKKARSEKARSDGKEVDKSEEVVHVRARRGQATDSHSLAERVRREKINNRLRCLQNIVPGCYKTMGMAGMLDEIINYVHSLQNQVEFLSMELAAASSVHHLNIGTEAIQKVQGTNAHEIEDMEKMVRQQYGEHTCFHSTRPL